MDFIATHVVDKCNFYEENDFHLQMGRVFAMASSYEKLRNRRSLPAKSLVSSQAANSLRVGKASRGSLSCPICSKEVTLPSMLERHMCEHFKGKLEAMLDPTRRKVCPFCSREAACFTANMFHMVSKHDVLFKVMPEDISDQFRALVHETPRRSMSVDAKLSSSSEMEK